MATNILIEEQLKRLPGSPGVYFFKDAEGNILYVGKAASLRNRVSSYFGSPEKLTEKTQRLVAQIAEIDFLVASSEQEALIFELDLIKEHRPRFNVRLKDDKTFPYLKIDLREDWPRIYMTRRLEHDGSYYFGPFASAKSLRHTIRVMKQIFPFRSCTKPITGADARACLEYHIGRCIGPCTGRVSREEHAQLIKQVISFLEGRQENVLRELKNRMNEAAAAMEFEKAALLRDRIQAIERIIEGQRIAASIKGEQDAIAFVQEGDQAFVQVFFIRGGRLIGRESFVVQGAQSERPESVMTGFVKQFYSAAPYVPPLILLQHPVEDAATLEEWLSSMRGGRIRLVVPVRGARKQLIGIVAENARQGLAQMSFKEISNHGALPAALHELEKELHLPRTPERIEGYDISNIQGSNAVGSMVVFEKGRPRAAHYRRFKIKEVTGANDYAMLQEVLRRRFRRSADEVERWPLPDLALIDGGRGQLNAAVEVLRELGAGDIPVIALAKENEEIFLAGQVRPIILPRSSPALQLLQRVRDEAHRFAIGYFQKVHKRESFSSVLDGIPGIGPKRKRALLRRFGSVKAIAGASIEDIAATEGMTRGSAKKIKELIH